MKPEGSRLKMFISIYGLSVTTAVLVSYALRWLIRRALQ